MEGQLRIVRHPAYVTAEQEWLGAMDAAQPSDLIFVVGLPGVGKSLLKIAIMSKLAGNPARWGVGRTPIASVRAAPTDRSFFSPKDFHARLLNEVRAPTLDWFHPTDEEAIKALATLKAEVGTARSFWRKNAKDAAENSTRRQFEDTARERELKYLVVDQAGSIAFTQRGRMASDHMYSLMCLADEVPLVLVMIGTPRMAALWEGDGEINRRSKFIFVERYRASNDGDMKEFAKICRRQTRELSFQKGAAPDEILKLIYVATLGVYDESENLFLRAESARVKAGISAIRIKDIEHAVLPAKQLKALYEQAEKFDDLRTAADIKALLERKVLL